ncbi:MAG: hypothetical protein AB8B85_15070 [Paracoccaceae bacterium]
MRYGQNWHVDRRRQGNTRAPIRLQQMTHRPNMTPADELGHIREELKRLKARETELRTEILETGDATGTDYTIEIKTQERRTLDKGKLPPEILEDPYYYKTSTSQIVRTVPVETAERRAAASLIDDDDT